MIAKEFEMVEMKSKPAVSVEHVAEAAWASEADAGTVDLVRLFQRLREKKRKILGIALVSFVLSTVVAFLLPLRYTSTTSFIPPSNIGNSGSMASMVAGQLSSLGAGDLLGSVKSPGDLYAGILQSRSIASTLVKEYDLMNVYHVKKESLAEKQLAAATNITIDSKSSIVTVDVSAKSPQLAHDLASAYMDALRKANGRLALGQSSERRLFFGEQLAKEKDDLEEAEVELKKTEEQSGLIVPDGQTEAEIKTIAGTQAQIAAREVELAALRDSATEQNSSVIRLRSEIEDLEGQLARLQRGGDVTSPMTIPTSKVPQVELDYVRKVREVKYHETLFEMLSKQYEAARLDEAQDAPVLQVLDPATYPDMKSGPKRSYFMLGGLLFGLAAGCTWVLVHERLQGLRTSLAGTDTH
jgi:tyrosine-protein kinase Etk/Wzc